MPSVSFFCLGGGERGGERAGHGAGREKKVPFIFLKHNLYMSHIIY
jgi:hypothetical protein